MRGGHREYMKIFVGYFIWVFRGVMIASRNSSTIQ